jgi:hypothetical protein
MVVIFGGSFLPEKQGYLFWYGIRKLGMIDYNRFKK